MKEIHLDSRLNAAAEYVTNNAVVADIGTDHAYLPCKLILSGRAKTAFACDINELPLKSAKVTVNEHSLGDKIKLILCDGLCGISESEQQMLTDIIICGMGGELIAKIIDEAKFLQNEKYNLILQPMTKAEYLRKYLCDNDFHILDETACIAAKKHYSVINAKFCGKSTLYDDMFLQIGMLKSKNDFAANEYKKMKADKLIKAANGILMSDKNDVSAKNMLETAEQILSCVKLCKTGENDD